MIKRKDTMFFIDEDYKNDCEHKINYSDFMDNNKTSTNPNISSIAAIISTTLTNINTQFKEIYSNTAISYYKKL